MKCNFCGELIKKRGLFNENVCVECENDEIIKTLADKKRYDYNGGPGQI